MLLAVSQFSTDADDEHGAVFAADGVLALLRCQPGIHLLELLAVYVMDFLGKERLDVVICLADEKLGSSYGCVYPLHHVAQESKRAVLLADDSFPVPLVDVERVQIVQLFVGTYGVHVGIDARSRLNLVVGKSQTLPFSKRMHHLRLLVAEVFDGERNRTLHAVKVVVDAETLQNEEGSSDAAQMQLSGKVLLEEVFYQFDALLGLVYVEQGGVMFGINKCAHIYNVFCL